MSVMSRDFTERTRGRVHDIKRETALEVGEPDAFGKPSIGYAMTLRTYSGYDVTGSEAAGNVASSVICVLYRNDMMHRWMTNVPYFNNTDLRRLYACITGLSIP